MVQWTDGDGNGDDNGDGGLDGGSTFQGVKERNR
ncbi:hypothetical protein A2U01_0102517, partial [Trifolium medium]|nr:hypothetical protein [Trifolium medium]